MARAASDVVVGLGSIRRAWGSRPPLTLADLAFAEHEPSLVEELHEACTITHHLSEDTHELTLLRLGCLVNHLIRDIGGDEQSPKELRTFGLGPLRKERLELERVVPTVTLHVLRQLLPCVVSPPPLSFWLLLSSV